MPDDVDDFIDHIDGLQETFEDMGSLLRLLKVEPGSSDDDLVAEVHEIGNQILEGQSARTASDQGHVVERKAGLKLGVLEESVEDYVRIEALLDADHDPDALA